MLITKKLNLVCAAFLLLTLTLSAQAPSSIRGRLLDRDGTRVLLLAGTPHERGVAEGYLTGRELVAGFKGFALSKQVVPMPRLWDTFLKPLIEARMEVPPRLKRRAEGIIEGIRQLDPALLKLKSLGRDLEPSDIIALSSVPDAAGFFCSSFASIPGKNEKRGTLVGRNLDYMATGPLLRAFAIRVNAPDGKRHGWVDLGYNGVIGCITGFSDAGAYVAIHDVHARPKRKAKAMTPRIVALMELMETFTPSANPTDEAAKNLGRFTYAMGGNAMVAWDTPGGPAGACVVEFGPSSKAEPTAIARQPRPEGFIACTNHFRDRKAPRRCRRFKSIVGNLQTMKSLDFAQGWSAIESASVRGTLYRLVADIRTGDVELDRRVKPRSPEYKKRLKFNYRKLIQEAAALAKVPRSQ